MSMIFFIIHVHIKRFSIKL